MKHNIGIDNSSQTHMVYICDDNEVKVKSFVISNDLKGFEKLHERLRDYPDHKIGFELPHGPLVDYLRDKGEAELYSLNPLKVKRFKETVNVSGDKSDPVDARAIAMYLKKNELVLRKMRFNSKEIEELNILRVSHDRLTKENARFSNRLRFIVRQYFPLYDTLFTEIACKTGLELLLKYPTWELLENESKENLMFFLKKNRYRNTKNIERFFSKIESYTQVINESVSLGLRVEAQAVARILLTLKEELGTIERRMEEVTESHTLGEVFKSLPGAGTVLTGKLMALFGDNKERFGQAVEVGSLFGTAPYNYASGNYEKVLARRACNKKARAILFQFAFSSLRFCGWAREYYDAQKQKNKTHSVAVRALSNKWVKVIFAMWKLEKKYDEEAYLKKKQKNEKVA